MKCSTCVAVVLALPIGCADPDPELGRQTSAIRDGTAAADPAVVALVRRRSQCDGPPPTVECSGTLLEADLVLTAAHCVERGARASLEVYFAPSPELPSGAHRGIRRSVVHPEYDRMRDDHDLALVWLDAPVPVRPLSLSQAALEPSLLGHAARVVGFGHSAVGTASIQPEMRQGNVTISALTDTTISYAPSPAMTCVGDSGGPVFVDFGQGEELVGVTASGDRECERSGVAARADVKLADFVVSPGEAPSRTSSTLGGLCTTSCSVDDECPNDLVCRADVDGTNRCLLPNVATGAFGDVCLRDAECGAGSCVPFDDECRCNEPCAEPSPASGGCSIASRPRGSLHWWVGFLALLLIARRAERVSKRSCYSLRLCLLALCSRRSARSSS
jgi:hypothetical protein